MHMGSWGDVCTLSKVYLWHVRMSIIREFYELVI